MDRRGPDIDESAVTSFERLIGQRLPDDYRRFLLEVNGGHAAANRMAPFGVRIRLLSLSDAAQDIDWSLESANSGYHEPPSKDLLYAGYDDVGSIIYVVITGELRGQVWIQDPEGRPDGSNPRVLWHDRRDMEKVADSFAEFARQLGPLQVAGAD